MTAQPPALYARWCRIDNDGPGTGDKWIAERWQFARRANREFWTELDGDHDQLRLAREDRDQLRKQVLDLATELEDEAEGTDGASVHLADHTARLVLEEQADAKRGAAVRIRKLADPT